MAHVMDGLYFHDVLFEWQVGLVMSTALYPNDFAHSQVKWPKCPCVT